MRKSHFRTPDETAGKIRRENIFNLLNFIFSYFNSQAGFYFQQSGIQKNLVSAILTRASSESAAR